MSQSVREWQRRADISLVDSRVRRRRHQLSLRPHGSEWRGFLVILAITAVTCLALYADVAYR